MNELKYWVWLSMVFGAANRRLWQLMSICETASEAHHELCSDSCFINLTDKEKKNVRAYTLKNAEELMAYCGRVGIGIVGYDSPDYPPQLRYIADPPAVLFYKGDIRCLIGRKTVVSVGARHAGKYSLNAAWRICSELAAEDYVIVSGFAMGIDITSHMAAAEQGKPTACILGCGIDVSYPRENMQYREKILSSGGVFISEYPPGTAAFSGNFPKRNRILAALGGCTMVFEASGRSGSIITANLSLDNGRDIFVLPPADIFSPSFAGSVLLLRDGATPLLGAEDVKEVFSKGSSTANAVNADAFSLINGIDRYDRGAHSGYRTAYETYREPISIGEKPEGLGESSKAPRENKSASVPERTVEKPAEKSGADLSSIPEGVQRDIAGLLLKRGMLHADIISAELDIDPTELMTELTELEILGAVKARPGRMYELA